MKIMVVGAGAVGREIARHLVAEDHDLSILDKDADSIQVASVPEATWVLADATSPTDLEEAGAKETDVLIAATGDDSVNLTTSLIAKSLFGVPKVIARANTAANEWMYDAKWGVDVLASAPKALSALVDRAVLTSEVVRLVSLRPDGAATYTVPVLRGSTFVARNPREVPIPEGLVLGAVMRDGAPHDVDQVGVLEANDELLIVAGRDAGESLQELGEILT